jgi:hypothetical protein
LRAPTQPRASRSQRRVCALAPAGGSRAVRQAVGGESPNGREPRASSWLTRARAARRLWRPTTAPASTWTARGLARPPPTPRSTTSGSRLRCASSATSPTWRAARSRPALRSCLTATCSRATPPSCWTRGARFGGGGGCQPRP